MFIDNKDSFLLNIMTTLYKEGGIPWKKYYVLAY